MITLTGVLLNLIDKSEYKKEDGLVVPTKARILFDLAPIIKTNTFLLTEKNQEIYPFQMFLQIQFQKLPLQKISIQWKSRL